MNHIVRSALNLLLVGFLGMGPVGLSLCICADGNVELRVGCCSDCGDTDNASDAQGNSGTAMFAAALGDRSTDCTYVPLSHGPMLHVSSHVTKPPLLAKGPLFPALPAECLYRRTGGDVGANVSRAVSSSIRVSASLLAQRTVVLRI